MSFRRLCLAAAPAVVALLAAVAFADQPGSSGSRGTTGVFRSADEGQSWTRLTTDTRPSGRIGGGDLPVPIPHPKLVDTEITVATLSWTTTDEGKTREVYKGRPAARTVRTAGSAPTIPTSSCSRPTRARSSRTTAERRGAPGTTSRSRRSITWAPTTSGRRAVYARSPSARRVDKHSTRRTALGPMPRAPDGPDTGPTMAPRVALSIGALAGLRRGLPSLAGLAVTWHPLPYTPGLAATAA